MPALSDAVASPLPAPTAPAAPAAPEFPSPFLDVVQGSVLGVTIPAIEGQTNELQEFVVQNFTQLQDAGLDYIELPDMQSVFFNPQVISEKDIQAAAEAGTLGQIAPLVEQLGAPPVIPTAEPAPQEGPAAAPPPANAGLGVLAGVGVAPAGASPGNTSKKLETTRLKNAAPPKPNTANAGPVPMLQRRAV
jgi:hypothetical protein